MESVTVQPIRHRSAHPGDFERVLGGVLLKTLSGAFWFNGLSVECAKGMDGPWDLRAAGCASTANMAAP
jgi:hypothetical protein